MPSLTRTLRPRPSIGQYARPSVVQVTARALGCTPATAAQVLNPSDSRCPFVRGAMIAEALLAHGYATRLDALCRPLDLVRQAPVPVEVSRAAFDAALEEEQRLDGAEDVAQLFITDAASWQTYRRRAVAHHAAQRTLWRIGDALYGVGA